MTKLQFVMQHRDHFQMLDDAEFFALIEKLQNDWRLTNSIVQAIEEGSLPAIVEFTETKKPCPKCDRKALDNHYKKSS